MKTSKRLILGATVALVAVSGLGALALNSSKTARADEAKTVTTEAKNEFASTLLDETVYVFLDADGGVKKTISSDWTKNDLGTDVYKKTEGKASTPVTVGVSYYLDGKKVSANEIRGRSGHVKIRYDYTNNERVNGMYMPYAVVSGAVLSNEHFSNVSVTNAKAVNDGTRTVIVGLALPGMRENLGVALEIPEFVEIEADAKDFKMEMTATLASSQIFAGVDTSALNSVASLSSQLDLLASSMSQLLDGSVQIRDGLATLNSKTGVLADGVSQLRAGSLKLVDGISTLSDGLGLAAAGSNVIATKINEVAIGAKQLDDGVAGAINKMTGSMEQLSSNTNQVITGANEFIDGIITELKKGNPLLADITSEEYEGRINNAIAILRAMGDDKNANKLDTTLKQLNFYKVIIEYGDGVVSELSNLPMELMQLKNGTSQLADGLPVLAEKINELSSKLSSAATGSKELATGMASLDAGISSLASNVPALTDGVSKLANGSNSLTDGLAKFNEEGVQKLVALYNGNVKALIERIQAIVSTAKSSGSKTKYIYKTAEI